MCALQDCIITNAVCGRKLIWVSASTLPSMGITDWKHIQVIMKHYTGTLSQPCWISQNKEIAKRQQ